MKSMKLAYVVLASATMVYTGCHSSKKTTTSTATVTTPTTPTEPPPAPKAEPTTDELVQAAHNRWPDVTAQTLNEGKDLYFNGACVNCHGAKKITRFSEEEWPSIVDRMASKAQISDTQKDAVLKYVMAVKMAAKP